MNFISNFDNSGITGKICVAIYNLSLMKLDWENIKNFSLIFQGDWVSTKKYGGNKEVFNSFMNKIFDRNQDDHNIIIQQLGSPNHKVNIFMDKNIHL